MTNWPDDFFKSVSIHENGLLTRSMTFSGHKLQGREKFQGMDVSIENKKGSVRKGTDSNGKKWETKMKIPYGYIRGTKGQDKDHLDCFVGPNKFSEKAFVIKQIKPDTGKFDEDKVMLGFDKEEDAKKNYLIHYDSPKYFGSIKEISVEELKKRAIENKEVNL